MNRKLYISPSMMCAKTDETARALAAFSANGIDYLHIDIMDGCFVPNFALGTDYCKEMKRLCDIPLDIHLMVTEPEKKLRFFDFGPGDIVSFHIESTEKPENALGIIKGKGAAAFIAVSPDTPLEAAKPFIPLADGLLIMTVHPGFAGQKMVPETLDKITRARKYLDENGFCDVLIEVDGNVSFENSVKMKNAGADIFVAGSSSVFNKELGFEAAIKKFREGLNSI